MLKGLWSIIKGYGGGACVEWALRSGLWVTKVAWDQNEADRIDILSPNPLTMTFAMKKGDLPQRGEVFLCCHYGGGGETKSGNFRVLSVDQKANTFKICRF